MTTEFPIAKVADFMELKLRFQISEKTVYTGTVDECLKSKMFMQVMEN